MTETEFTKSDSCPMQSVNGRTQQKVTAPNSTGKRDNLHALNRPTETTVP